MLACCTQPVSMLGELNLAGRSLPLALALRGGAAIGGGSEQHSPACQLQHVQQSVPGRLTHSRCAWPNWVPEPLPLPQ